MIWRRYDEGRPEEEKGMLYVMPHFKFTHVMIKMIEI